MIYYTKRHRLQGIFRAVCGFFTFCYEKNNKELIYNKF